MTWLTLDKVDRVDTVDRVYKVELSLAKPGGGEALTELTGLTRFTQLTELTRLQVAGYRVVVDRVDRVNKVDMVDTVDKVDRVDRVDRVGMVDTVDRVDEVDIVDMVDRVDRLSVDTFNKVELSLAKPGGGEASPRGEASRESALPTSLLACPSGGWPLNLLEVRIVGTKVACNIRSWQYIVVKKLISSSFRMTVILLREVISPVGGVTLIYTAGAMVMVVLCLECPFPRSRLGTAARGTYPGRAMRKIKIEM